MFIFAQVNLCYYKTEVTYVRMQDFIVELFSRTDEIKRIKKVPDDISIKLNGLKSIYNLYVTDKIQITFIKTINKIIEEATKGNDISNKEFNSFFEIIKKDIQK